MLNNNVIQFKKYKQKLKKEKTKSKHKPKYYVAVPKIVNKTVQGWGFSKKEFLKDCAGIFKQMLDEHNAEYFFDCHRITKDKVKNFSYKSIQNYAIKKTKEKYNL
tara:strand:- start:46 stop:360 length:315 start_codon:yes stop_codon:yes gene_type:complete